MHSEYSQVCRLSEYDRLNGKVEADGEYNYFENLMGELWTDWLVVGGMRDEDNSLGKGIGIGRRRL